MNKKLILRVIGIISALMLMVSMFVPFTNFEGFTQVFFKDFNDEYVAYILNALGLLAIVVFVLNKKKELAYITVGASLIVAIIYTITLKDNFSYLSFGYYLLVISPILMFISVILYPKEEVIPVFNENKEEFDNNISNTNIISEPNEYAKSIMEQPVMRDISELQGSQSILSQVEQPVITPNSGPQSLTSLANSQTNQNVGYNGQVNNQYETINNQMPKSNQVNNPVYGNTQVNKVYENNSGQLNQMYRQQYQSQMVNQTPQNISQVQPNYSNMNNVVNNQNMSGQMAQTTNNNQSGQVNRETPNNLGNSSIFNQNPIDFR